MLLFNKKQPETSPHCRVLCPRNDFMCSTKIVNFIARKKTTMLQCGDAVARRQCIVLWHILPKLMDMKSRAEKRE